MFHIMSNDQTEIPVLCDTLSEAQNPSTIIEFFQGNEDFEGAEIVEVYARDETQGVKLIQKVFIYPRTPEQEQAEQEAAEAIKVLKALAPKYRLLCTPTQVELIQLFDSGNDTIQHTS